MPGAVLAPVTIAAGAALAQVRLPTRLRFGLTGTPMQVHAAFALAACCLEIAWHHGLVFKDAQTATSDAACLQNDYSELW